jgi:energy-converting hydrogenase Eha subunit G
VNFAEKSLYHQIHPLKLITDIGSSLISLYFFWRHDITSGLLVGIAPGVAVSFVIIQFVNLDRYRRSSLGRYVGRYMTWEMQALRAAGQLVVWVGTWYHVLLLVFAGFAMIVFGWIRGRLLP